PGRKYLLTSNNDLGPTSLRDAKTGAIVCDFPGGHAAFSPDGSLVANVSQDVPNGAAALTLWETETGRARTQWRLDQRQFGSLAFAPDGKTVALACGPGRGINQSEVRLWDVVASNELPPIKRQGADTSFVVFSPDGQFLAAAGRMGGIELFDVKG